jgi:hypothetical protein
MTLHHILAQSLVSDEPLVRLHAHQLEALLSDTRITPKVFTLARQRSACTDLLDAAHLNRLVRELQAFRREAIQHVPTLVKEANDPKRIRLAASTAVWLDA